MRASIQPPSAAKSGWSVHLPARIIHFREPSMSALERGYEYLCLDQQGGVLTCTFSNPPRQTLTGKGVRALLQLVDDVNADASVRVLVFVGEDPEIFVAHYEVSELSTEEEEAAARAQDASESEQDDAEVKLHRLNRSFLNLERTMRSQDAARAMRVFRGGGKYEWKGE